MIKRKNKPVLTPPPEAENTLYFFNDKLTDIPGYDSYYFSKWEPFDRDYDNFMPVVCDAYEEIFKSMTAVDKFGFAIQLTRGILFPFIEKDVGWLEGDSDKILDYLCLHSDLSCFFWRKKEKLEFKDYPFARHLYVAKENPSAEFIKEAYMDTQSNNGATHNFQMTTKGYSAKARDILPMAEQNKKPDISIYYDADLTSLKISRHQLNYPIEKLTEALIKATQKHGKKLEIDI